MKGFLITLSALGVLGLAFWAYQENYRTQAAQRDTRDLQREIGALRHRLAMLKAEWAYLNRPERLAELAALNYDRLGLLPFQPEQFGIVEQVAFPPWEEDLLRLLDPIDTAAEALP